jgi:hypothetical protein
MPPTTIGCATALRGDCQTQPAELVGRHEGWVWWSSCRTPTNMTGRAGQPKTRLSVCLSCGKATVGGEDIPLCMVPSFKRHNAKKGEKGEKGEASSRGRGPPMNNGTAESQNPHLQLTCA